MANKDGDPPPSTLPPKKKKCVSKDKVDEQELQQQVVRVAAATSQYESIRDEEYRRLVAEAKQGPTLLQNVHTPLPNDDSTDSNSSSFVGIRDMFGDPAPPPFFQSIPVLRARQGTSIAVRTTTLSMEDLHKRLAQKNARGERMEIIRGLVHARSGSSQSPQQQKKVVQPTVVLDGSGSKPKLKDDDQSSTDDDDFTDEDSESGEEEEYFSAPHKQQKHQEHQQQQKERVCCTTAEADSNWVQDSGGVEFFDNVLTTHTVMTKEIALATAASTSVQPRQMMRIPTSARFRPSRLIMDTTVEPRTFVHPWHVSFYLFEACGDEQPCVNGENCVARQLIPHPEADKTDAQLKKATAEEFSLKNGVCPTFQWNRNPPPGGIILKAFKTEARRGKDIVDGTQPPVQGPCILCIRSKCQLDKYLAETQVIGECDPPHYHPVNVPGGYRSDACLQWSRTGRTDGDVMNMRHFHTTEYIPMMLDEAIKNGCIGLLAGEVEMLKKSVAMPSSKIKSGVDGYPRARGYLEKDCVLFFQVTRLLSLSAASFGAEPHAAFVPMLTEVTPPPVFFNMVAHVQQQQQQQQSEEDGPMRNSAPWKNRKPGSFVYLVSEAAICTGYDITAVRLLLDSFCDACSAVKTCLLYEEQSRDILHPQQPIHDLTFAETELLKIVRSQRIWSRFPMPYPLSDYSIVATLWARNEIVEQVRRYVANDVAVTASQCVLKRTKYNELVEKRATDGVVAPPVIPAKPTSGGLGLTPIQKMTIAQTDVVTRAAKANSVAVHGGGTRDERSSEDGVLRKKEGKAREKPYPQKHLDSLLMKFSVMHIAHKPLSRWVCAAIASRRKVDDFSLVGYSAPRTGVKSKSFSIAVTLGLGEINPDIVARLPFGNIEKQKPSSHQPSFDVMPVVDVCTMGITKAKSETKIHPITVADPPVVRVVYPSHREAILRWIDEDSKQSSATQHHFTRKLALEMPFVDALTKLDVAPIRGQLPSERLKQLTLGDVLREFWETSHRISTLEIESDVINSASSGDIGNVLPLWMHRSDPTSAVPSTHTYKSGRYSLAAALIARVSLANALISHASDKSVAHRTLAFMTTHTDLVLAVQWDGDAPSINSELTSSEIMKTGKADMFYPSDWRCKTEGEEPSLSAALSYLDLFGQSNPVTSKSLTHAFAKTFPRACQSRESIIVTMQACLESRGITEKLIECIFMTLSGGYAHATFRPSFNEYLNVRQILGPIEKDLFGRTDALAALDDFKLYTQNLKTYNEKLNQYSSTGKSDTIHAAVIAADVFSAATGAIKDVLSMELVLPFQNLATSVRFAISEAIAIEFYRRLLSRHASPVEKGTFITQKESDAIDSKYFSKGITRLPPRDESTTDALQKVIERVVIKNALEYIKVRNLLFSEQSTKRDITRNAVIQDLTHSVREAVGTFKIRMLGEESAAFSSERGDQAFAVACALRDTFSVLAHGSVLQCTRDLRKDLSEAEFPLSLDVAVHETTQILMISLKRNTQTMDSTGDGGQPLPSTEQVSAKIRSALENLIDDNDRAIAFSEAFAQKMPASGEKDGPSQRQTEVKFVRAILGEEHVKVTIKSVLASAIDEFLPSNHKSLKEHIAMDSVVAMGRAIACGLPDIVMGVIAESAPVLDHIVEVVGKTLTQVQHLLAKHASALVPDGSQLAQDVITRTLEYSRKRTRRPVDEEEDEEEVEEEEDQPRKRKGGGKQQPYDMLVAMTRGELLYIEKYYNDIRQQPPFKQLEGTEQQQTTETPEFAVKRYYPDGGVDEPPLSAINQWCDARIMSLDWLETTMKQGTATAAFEEIPKTRPTKTSPITTTIPELVKTANKSILSIVSDASALAYNALKYVLAIDVCQGSMSGAEDYVESKNQTSVQSFVMNNPTLITYVIREMIITALSRAPSMAAALYSRGKWFIEFYELVGQVCDHIRSEVAKNGHLPTNEELTTYVTAARKTLWGDKVFRLYKNKEHMCFSRTFAKIESDARKMGVFINERQDKFAADAHKNRQKLMWEYLLSEVAAHGYGYTNAGTYSGTGIDTSRRDLETLWRFGMREHGLNIIARMHKSYVTYGGSNERTKIAEGLYPAELELAATYYDMAYKASVVKVLPLRSRIWTEQSLAALCENHCVTDGKHLPVQLTTLYVCDSCKSVVTQIAPQSIKPVNTSSCFGAAMNSRGEVVCADRRNLGKLGKKRSLEDFYVNKVLEDGKCKGNKAEHQQALDHIIGAKTTTETDEEEQTSDSGEEEEDILKQQQQQTKRQPPPQSIFSWATPCQDTPMRTVSALGAMIEFDTKYPGTAERSATSKLPLVIIPCCGKFTRKSPDSSGVDGTYECLACQVIRGTHQMQLPSCVACGRPVPLANREQQIVQQYQHQTKEIFPVHSDTTRAFFQSRIDVMCRRTRDITGKNNVKVGDLIPVTSSTATFVFDDVTTFSILPLDLCERCARYPQIRRSDATVSLSTLITFSKERQIEEEQRAVQQKIHFYTHADKSFKPKHKK